MVTVIAQLEINDDAPQELAKYFEITMPLLEAAKAKIVRRYSTSQVIVGTETKLTIVVVEYPSHEAVRSVFDSPAYQSAIPHRDVAFHYYQISVCDDGVADELADEATKHLD